MRRVQQISVHFPPSTSLASEGLDGMLQLPGDANEK